MGDFIARDIVSNIIENLDGYSTQDDIDIQNRNITLNDYTQLKVADNTTENCTNYFEQSISKKRRIRKVVPVELRCTKKLKNEKLCSFKRCSESIFCSRHEKKNNFHEEINMNNLNLLLDVMNQTYMEDYYKRIEK
jgi:hypothetical protein